MKYRSELRGEVAEIIREIAAQELREWEALRRLKSLKQRAFDMCERLDRGPADREDVESYGALHDEVMKNN